MITDLPSLLAPLTPERFFAERAGRRAFHQPGSADRTRSIEAQLGGLDVESVAARHGAEVQIWEDDPVAGYTVRSGTAADAASAYRAGATLYVRDLPALRPFTDGIGAALGVAPESIWCSLFMTPAGRGTRCHFDSNETLTIQLRGRKVWRVAGNAHVQAPLHNWVAGQPVSRALRSYAALPLPTELSAAADSFALEPGSVLYVPRGHWHATETGDDTVSVCVGFRPSTWSDVLLPVARALLAADEEARQYAAAPWAGDAAAVERIAARLGRAMLAWAAGPAQRSPGDGYRRRPFAQIEIAPGLVRVSAVSAAEQRDSELEIADEVAPLIEWIARQREAFTVDDASRAHPALDREAVEETLDALLEAELVETA